MNEQPPVWLQPIHSWFFLWEDLIPSLYRVLAVASGAAVTAIVVVLLGGVDLIVAVPVATAAWIVVAMIQEHDGRVVLDVDPEFLGELLSDADPVLARAGYGFNSASGPCRARGDRSDTVLYEAIDPQGGCIDLWITRGRTDGRLEVMLDGRSLEDLVASHGDPELASRVTRAEHPAADVAAIVAGLQLVLPDSVDPADP